MFQSVSAAHGVASQRRFYELGGCQFHIRIIRDSTGYSTYVMSFFFFNADH